MESETKSVTIIRRTVHLDLRYILEEVKVQWIQAQTRSSETSISPAIRSCFINNRIIIQ